MAQKTTISCCNKIFSEGLREIMGKQIPGMQTSVINYQEIRETPFIDADLLIADCNTFSRIMSHDSFNGNKIKVLLFGAYCRPLIEKDHMLNLISRGLAGILTPTAEETEFIKAVKTILSGELWFERKKLNDILVDFDIDEVIAGPKLTSREKEVVQLICKGCRNKEIMEHLDISEQSVKSHLSRINKKCGVTDRLQLALYALKQWPELSE